MGIELQLNTGDEEWMFNLTEAVIPGPGDDLTIDDPEGGRGTSGSCAGGSTSPRATPWDR